MTDIALLFPVKYKKFYINPFHLQKIKAMLESTIGEEEISVTLYDVNSSSCTGCLADTFFHLAIIDVPEGQLDVAGELLSRIHADYFIITGEEVKYGQYADVFNRLSPLTRNPLFLAEDDEEVIAIVKQYKQSGFLRHHDQFVAFSSDFKSPLMHMKKLQMEFPDWMVELYDHQGMQIFMDGLSRGCENNCFFCKLNNEQCRRSQKSITKSQVDVIATIKTLQSICKKSLYIQFTDENFFGDGMERLRAIQHLCDELASINYAGVFGIDSRLDSIYNPHDSDATASYRAKTWTRFAHHGLRYCFLGIETFSHSQARRYNKKLDLSNFDSAVAFLNKNGILFTVGLIIWDPLMTKEELLCNLDYIKKHSLLGKTASLLKCLRVQINSQYLKRYGDSFALSMRSQDCFNLDDDCIRYTDSRIQSILPYVRYAYDMFNKHGYRHSDVALFEVLFDTHTPDILFEIPSLVANFEYELLLYLLNISAAQSEDEIYSEIDKRGKNLVSTILSMLEKIGSLSDIKNDSVLAYYQRIFQRIANDGRKE